MPAFKVFPATRVVATPEAINTANWPINSLVLPLALDEVLVLEKINSDVLDAPHSIIISDTGFTGAWIAPKETGLCPGGGSRYSSKIMVRRRPDIVFDSRTLCHCS